jgi:hypothetical protein
MIAANRILGVLLPLVIVTAAQHATPALAQDAAWRVSKATGDVSVASADGVQTVALTDGAALKPGEVIRTGANGRVLLMRGAESILVSPNSIVGLPREQHDGMTTVVEQAGTILLEVEKRNVKHFEVETPYLAAVVKGTQFRVTVGGDDSRVDVLRGQVDVTDYKSGQHALVFPDQAATVSAQGSTGLTLSGLGIFSRIEQGSPRAAPPPLRMPALVTASREGTLSDAGRATPPQGGGSNESIWSGGTSDVGSSWTDRVVAFASDLFGSDRRNGGERTFSASDLALPLATGLLVTVGVAFGRLRQKGSKKSSRDRRPS